MAYSEAKTQKELRRLEAKSKLKIRWFNLFIVTFIILCLAYVVDEIASNINSILQQEVLETFFKVDKDTYRYNEYLIVTTLCSGVAFFSFFYKALSDRFGRKKFLIINTIGLSIGMFICFVSRNVVFYSIGLIVMYFFTPCDIQIIYILETSNPKYRALCLSIAKAIATLGIIIVPSLHDWAKSLGSWNLVFLIPACIGLVIGIICIFFMRESPVFVESRIGILKEKLKNNGKTPSKEKKIENAEGGILSAIKYMFKHKVLVWLFFIALIFSICIIGVLNFGLMGSEGTDYNIALIIYPIACAILQITIGFLADIIGRKKASIVAGVLTLIGIILFGAGGAHKFSPVVVGIALGTFIAGYYSLIDMTNVMCSEESPTNLRSSIMSLIGVATSIGSFLPVLVLLIVNAINPKANVSIAIVAMVAPAVLIGTIFLLLFVPETYRNSMTNIRQIFNKKKAKKDKTENS